MGFGILLFGYALAFAFTLSPYYFFSDIFGGLIMAYAFMKLSAFHVKFKPSMISSFVYTFISSIIMLNKLGILSFNSSFAKVGVAALAGAIIVLHFLMFDAIIALTTEIDLPKITIKARRNIIIMIIYFTIYSLALLSFDRMTEIYPRVAFYISRGFTLFQLMWMIINLLLIGSCLKWIGVEGEDLPKDNPTRWEKINKKWSDAEDVVFTPKEKRGGIVNPSKNVDHKPNVKKKRK